MKMPRWGRPPACGIIAGRYLLRLFFVHTQARGLPPQLCEIHYNKVQNASECVKMINFAVGAHTAPESY